MPYHLPVLLKESVEGLKINPNGVYVDATFGGGGHSKEIMKKLDRGQLIAFDQDEDAIGNMIDDPRFLFVNHNFRYLKHFLKYYHVNKVDGILADLGVSSHHFDEKNRGFSFRWKESPLDMRMNQRAGMTAESVLNEYDEEKLRYIFSSYGELPDSKRLTTRILKKRENQRIATMDELTQLLHDQVPTNRENKYMAKIFQALRIEVNREIDNLKRLLNQVTDLLPAGGRLVVISYHSLEDRVVKNFIKAGNFEGSIEKDFYGNVQAPFMAVNKKPTVPGANEIEENKRARSAKLRIAEKR